MTDTEGQPMSANETQSTESSSDELAPGDITDYIVVLSQHDKGRAQVEASKGLAECVEAALATGKKGGTVKVTTAVEPLDSGAVKLTVTVESKPVKDPAGSVWFTDGEGHLSRDNAGMFYGK